MKENSGDSKIKELLRLREEGYLFHGSSNPDITILEPRQASDPDPTRIFNNDLALYATDALNFSILFALVDAKKLPQEIAKQPWGAGIEGRTIVARIPKAWQKYLQDSKGYIYVLDRRTFTYKQDNQYKSLIAVKPLSKFEVTFGDYERIGGVISWT